MKLAKKILICVAGGLAFVTNLRADNVLLPGNPYATVVVRNIFGLNPPPLVDPNATTAQPPVKITPNGIMSIFGELQVLFKVAGKQPGQDAYTLSEGEQQDDITVVKIDEKAGVVTFNNHGIVQALPLVAATASSGPASAPSSAPGSRAMPGTAPGSAGRNTGANGFMNSFGNRGGNVPGSNGSGGNNPANSIGSTSDNRPAIIQQPQNNMTVEESDAIIEVTREANKTEIMNGDIPPPPPTVATPAGSPGMPP